MSGVKRKMFLFTVGLSVSMLCHAQGYTQERIDLSIGSKAQAVISIDMQTPTQQFAAAELAKYLNIITGGEFLITGEAVGNTPEIRLKVSEGSGGENFQIKLDDQAIVLTGNSNRALLYAVYKLLERLGCVWMAPDFHFYNENNAYIPSKPTLSYVHKGDVAESPDLKYRKIYVEEGPSHAIDNLPKTIDWILKGGFNTIVFPMNFGGRGEKKWDNWRADLIPELQKRDIIIEVGGHGYQNFLNAKMDNGQLFKKNPEWFGVKDGKRSAEKRRIFCTSNADALAYVHGNLLNYLKDRPEIEIFDFWPPDGGRWCECSECEKIGTPSDQHARLINLTSRFLAKHVPDLKVEGIAYAMTRELPNNFTVDKDILIDFCPISQRFEEQIYESTTGANNTYRKNIIAWEESSFQGDFSIYSYYRKFQWRSLPVLLPHYMQKDLKWFKGKGVAGISTYAEPADWYAYEINHYVLGKLAWDVNADVDKLIETFARARYNGAAETAEFVYQTLEDVVRFATNIVGTSIKTVEEYDQYLEKMKLAQQEIDKASAAFASDKLVSNNLYRLGLSVRYATLNILIQQHTAADGPESLKKELVDKKIELIEANEGQGVFLIEPRLRRDRLYSYYKVKN